MWNKSNREHKTVGSEPSSARAAADAAVRELGWARPYFLDADHINLETVERFEEDLTDRIRLHGPIRAKIMIGEAIEVSPTREGRTSKVCATPR